MRSKVPLFPGYAPEVDSSSRRWKLIMSHALDWIVTIALGGGSVALDLIPGFKRQFSLTDTTLFHPLAVHERVPIIALYCICAAAPFVIQLVINLLTVRSWWDAHSSTLGLVLSLAITNAITQVTKVTVGRPRPDLIARCMPQAGVSIPSFGLASSRICTQTDHNILEDGWRSFPSGHSSLSFAGLGFLAFYVAGKLHLFDKQGRAFQVKAWLSLVPLVGAALVAISRTMDYRHHATDVLTGSLLGFVVAYFCYRRYYPSLAAALSHRPYSPQLMRDELLPTHQRAVTGRDIQGRYTDVRMSEDDQELRVETQAGQRGRTGVWKDDVSRHLQSS